MALATKYFSLYLEAFAHATTRRVFLQLTRDEHMQNPACKDLFSSVRAIARIYDKAEAK
jgi:hypothetical protein